MINEWFELTNEQALMFISECIKIEKNNDISNVILYNQTNNLKINV